MPACDLGASAGIHFVRADGDLLAGRHAMRHAAGELGFDLIGQTVIITAASELMRNAYVYGGGGVLSIEADRSRRTARPAAHRLR